MPIGKVKIRITLFRLTKFKGGRGGSEQGHATGIADVGKVMPRITEKENRGRRAGDEKKPPGVSTSEKVRKKAQQAKGETRASG